MLPQTYLNIEIVIVNDGSTDPFTNEKLSIYNKKKTRVVTIENGGLANARNAGILNSSGEYILPLDADDKIGNGYLEKAVCILDADSDVGIVYCDAEFFGAQTGKWDLQKFDINEFLLCNHIFCSGFFRRKDFDRTHGCQKNMKYGWEDWDFWLSLLELDVKVERINEIFFYYRRRDDSMIYEVMRNDYKFNYLQDQIIRNHSEFYLKMGLNPIKLSLENRKNKLLYSETLGKYEELTKKYDELTTRCILSDKAYHETSNLYKNLEAKYSKINKSILFRFIFRKFVKLENYILYKFKIIQ